MLDFLNVAIDCRRDEIAFNTNQDRTQIEPGKHGLIGSICRSVCEWSCPCDDSAYNSVHRIVNVADGRCIQDCSGVCGLAKKSLSEATAGQPPNGIGKFSIAERLDQIGDVVAEKRHENCVLVIGIDEIAFVKGVVNRK